MRKMVALWALVGFLSVAHFAHAQGSLKVVQDAKRDLQAQGVDLSGACGAFRITNLVAWRLRPAYGFLLKRGGNRAIVREDGSCVNGDNPGDGYATDYLIQRSTGYGYDILSDGGSTNGPQGFDQPETDAEMVARNKSNFVEPFDWAVVVSGDGSSESRPIIAMPLANIAAQVRASAACYNRTDDDYWIHQADHAGQFSNGKWYMGWNAYWFARMVPNDTGSADPNLAGKPAPGCGGTPVDPPSHEPPAPTPTVDLGPLNSRIDNLQAFANDVLAQLNALRVNYDAVIAALTGRVAFLESRPIPASCTVKASLFGINVGVSCKLQ